MGIIDNIKSFFGGSNNAQVVQYDDPYKKSMLVDQIVNSIDKIKKINSLDSSIWNLSNISTGVLMRKSLAELEGIKDRLDSRLSELTRQSQRNNPQREALEASKWTGVSEEVPNEIIKRCQERDR